jgi:hypothetical protein
MTFRPGFVYRFAIMTEWPGFFSGFGIAIGALILKERDVLPWYGVAAVLAVLAYGSWRSWNVSVTFRDATLIVRNPLRTQRIQLGREYTFRPGMADWLYPPAPAVEVSGPGGPWVIVAAGGFSVEQKREFAAATRTVSVASGCAPLARPEWVTTWPGI